MAKLDLQAGKKHVFEPGRREVCLPQGAGKYQGPQGRKSRQSLEKGESSGGGRATGREQRAKEKWNPSSQTQDL